MFIRDFLVYIVSNCSGLVKMPILVFYNFVDAILDPPNIYTHVDIKNVLNNLEVLWCLLEVKMMALLGHVIIILFGLQFTLVCLYWSLSG